MKEIKIITKGLNLFYGEKQALKNITLNIPDKKLLHSSDLPAVVNLLSYAC